MENVSVNTISMEDSKNREENLREKTMQETKLHRFIFNLY